MRLRHAWSRYAYLRAGLYHVATSTTAFVRWIVAFKPTMLNKVVESPYPLIDADPHASRVVRYMRPSDYAVWAGVTGAFPAALYCWGVFPL
jgi:hypothetical protein